MPEKDMAEAVAELSHRVNRLEILLKISRPVFDLFL